MKNEIKAAALKYFTLHGYEGASLAQIADEVGIKKQSLYAHFKGKDDLFMQVLRDAAETELSSKLQYFGNMGNMAPEKALYGFLQLTIDLFQKNEQLKFWLRVSFFPPAHLIDAITQEIVNLEEQVQATLESKFRDWIQARAIADQDPKVPTLAFQGIVDSILLELVYVNDEERLRNKMEASWAIFWRGISHR